MLRKSHGSGCGIAEHGLQFRRQVPIDRYIVDFYCHELRSSWIRTEWFHDRPEQAKIGSELHDYSNWDTGYSV